MLESVKQIAIDKYNEELTKFLNKFVKLSLEQKLFRFALLISGFNAHFVDHGKRTPSESEYIKNYRFYISLSLLNPEICPANNEFYISLEGDEIEKLINKLLESIVYKLQDKTNKYFGDAKFMYMLDKLIQSIDENKLI